MIKVKKPLNNKNNKDKGFKITAESVTTVWLMANVPNVISRKLKS